MTATLRILLMVALAAGCTRRAAAPVEKPAPGEIGEIAAETPLAAQLDETIGAREAEEGDPWSATFVRPVVDARGRVVIPAGSKLEGTITAIVPGDEFPARIDLAVERIRTPTRTRAVSGRVVSSELHDEPRQRSASGFNRAMGVGALMGWSALGFQGAAAGMVGGATTGIATAVERFRWRDAKIQAGSFVTVMLDEPLSARELR